MSGIVEVHRRAPSALAFMSRALARFPRLATRPRFVPIVERWVEVKSASDHERRFRETTGLDGTSILYPQVLGFRLQMALLTHPSFPLPIWNALQIRNRLTLHRRLDAGAIHAFETTLDDYRFLEKGVEVDLRTRLFRAGGCDWEGVTTYYYRGRFDAARPSRQPAAAPNLTLAQAISSFRAPRSGGLAFGQLTGDFNGVHLSRAYARRLGFPGAFLHPQRSAALCLQGLGRDTSAAGTLELWIKGPVPYGAEITLSSTPEPGGTAFGLALSDDVRFAIAGRYMNLV